MVECEPLVDGGTAMVTSAGGEVEVTLSWTNSKPGPTAAAE
jgi:hypothetical protein